MDQDGLEEVLEFECRFGSSKLWNPAVANCTACVAHETADSIDTVDS